jgi:hypothetical protein
MIQRWLVPAGATVFSFLLLLAALASPFFLFFTLGLPPCEDESVFYDLTRLAVPASLLASAVWLHRLKHAPRTPAFLVALAVPTVALGANAIAARLEIDRQAACEKRDLTQARVSCGANPAHYRAGKDQFGNATLTLVAPGTTDESWDCLWNWATHNGSVSLLVDESVYEQHRRMRGRS